MAATHDPLTEKQLAILDRAPFEFSIGDLEASGDRADVHFLAQLGLLTSEQTHISADAASNRYRWTRTSKPVPEQG